MEKRLYMLCLTLCLCFIGAGAFNLLRAQQSASRPIYRTESAVIGYRSVTGIYGLFIKKSQFFFESTDLHGGDASFRYSSGKTPHVVRFSGEGPYRCLENAICAGNALYAGTKAFFVSIDSRRFPEVSIIIPINDTCQTMELPCPSVLPLFIAWTEAS